MNSISKKDVIDWQYLNESPIGKANESLVKLDKNDARLTEHAPLAKFESSFAIFDERTCNFSFSDQAVPNTTIECTESSDIMTNSLYMIPEMITENQAKLKKKSKTFSLPFRPNDFNNNEIKVFNTPEKCRAKSKNDLTNSGRVFSYNQLGLDLNTIDKSLIKHREELNREFNNDIVLLSIELETPFGNKNKERVMENTPVLIHKLNKNQIKTNKATREFIGKNYDITPSSPIKSSLKLIETEHENIETTLDNLNDERRNKLLLSDSEDFVSHFNPPTVSCIQSLLEMVKLIKNKFNFNKSKTLYEINEEQEANFENYESPKRYQRFIY